MALTPLRSLILERNSPLSRAVFHFKSNLHHGFAFPAATLPAPNVHDGAVEFVGRHAKPKAGEAKAYDKCENKRSRDAECPHHAATDKCREFGIARGTERRGDDEVDCFKRLDGDIAPKADFAERNDFRIVRENADERFAVEGYDERENEAADAADSYGLLEASVCLVVIVSADEVCNENLVAAAEANAQDNGECGEVACENAGGHGGGAHVNDHRGDEHLEKLKADGFCGGGEAYANPVGENSAGAFDVSAVRVVLDFKTQYKPKNDGGENP